MLLHFIQPHAIIEGDLLAGLANVYGVTKLFAAGVYIFNLAATSRLA